MLHMHRDDPLAVWYNVVVRHGTAELYALDGGLQLVDTLLSRKLCETERTQSELHDWVESTLRAYSETFEGRNALRLREGFLEKRFMEEIRPLSLVADHCFQNRPGVLFRPVLGNQSFDAIITDRAVTLEVTIQVEFTQADYDEEMFARMLHLKEHGHAPGTGPIIKSRTKRTGISVEAELEFVEHCDGQNAQFSKIEQAAISKAKAKYRSQTHLGIVYDGLCISTHEDFRELRRFASETLAPLLGQFDHLYLIRSEGDHVLSLPLSGAAV